MVMRLRKQKHPVPDNVRSMAKSVRHRMSRKYQGNITEQNQYQSVTKVTSSKALDNYRKSQGVIALNCIKLVLITVTQVYGDV